MLHLRVHCVNGFRGGEKDSGRARWREIKGWVRRAEALPQFVEVRLSRLAYQPGGLPCIEQAALALRFAPEDHEELIREGEEFIGNWVMERGRQ